MSSPGQIPNKLVLGMKNGTPRRVWLNDAEVLIRDIEVTYDSDTPWGMVHITLPVGEYAVVPLDETGNVLYQEIRDALGL